MECEKCGKPMHVVKVVNDGVTRSISQCTVCKHWVGIKCPFCQKDVETEDNECILSGFVEDGDLAHITCVFIPDNKYPLIASTIHEENRSIIAAANIRNGTNTELPPLWYALDPQEKRQNIAVVKQLENHFLVWMKGYSLANQLKDV